ncbi:uncharacterized protein LOC119687481 [Teleopsis dalmanni]|uniref:uncharacterized protein LOC119687481 n=1 Tax=Teleopsis dalmanni TaxID=139649 RepID=UPI0018CC7F8E|nr:uncharacterized protein LOC119687481 [Teleopsis dalmanni]
MLKLDLICINLVLLVLNYFSKHTESYHVQYSMLETTTLKSGRKSNYHIINSKILEDLQTAELNLNMNIPQCLLGYERRGEICVPICAVPCRLHTFCSAPNTCNCAQGYHNAGNSSGECVPECMTTCGSNAHCRKPNVCACNTGYVLVDLQKCVKRCRSDFLWNDIAQDCIPILPAASQLIAEEMDLYLPAVNENVALVSDNNLNLLSRNNSYLTLNADVVTNTTDGNDLVNTKNWFNISTFFVGFGTIVTICLLLVSLQYYKRMDDALRLPIIQVPGERYGDYPLDRSQIMVY